jgi:hypothetical protein
MSADRGTLRRGNQAPPDQQQWPQATAPASRRPPSAPRERRPALAALALLLIVGGALAAAYLVIQNGHRVSAIEVTQQVGAGQKIPLSAMQEVQIAPGDLSYVPWSEAGQVAQYYAANVIAPGTLLSSAMVARSSNLSAGREVLGLALKDGQLPAGLAVGDRVAIYEVSDSTQSCPGTPGATLTPNAVVLGVGTPPAAVNDSAIDVRVAVYPGAAGAVACNAANGNVSIAVLPAGRAAAPPASLPSPPASTPSGSAKPPAGNRGQPQPTPTAGTPTPGGAG